MKKIIIPAFIFLVLPWFIAPIASANDSTVSTVAEMVMHLNHYPSSSEKQILANIIHDHHATVGEKALAGALMRMEHSVQGSDAATLQALASDEHANHDERALADILLGIRHHPSSSDKKRLQSLHH